MKFWTIFRYEFCYQVRRPWTWLFVVILLALDFLMTRDGSISNVLYADFFLNSPYAIANVTVFGNLLWLVMAASIAGDAAARDVATGMHPLTYTVPVSKAEYLGGRFLAAFALNAMILLSVQIGILLGIYLPGIHPDLIGPFRPAGFILAYAIIALPNAFAATAIQFMMAVRSGRAMAGYVGSFFLIFMGFFIASILLFKRSMGTFLDPIGIRFFIEDMAHLWTTAEKNTRLITLEGILLENRLVWSGMALLVLGVTYISFRFAHRTGISWWRRLRRQTDAHAPSAVLNPTGEIISIPEVPRTFGIGMHIRQTLAIAWPSFRTIATSKAGLALLVFIPLLTIAIVVDQMSMNGTPLIPTTPRVIAELTGNLSDEMSRWVIIPFLIILFAGELVWRERDARLDEITDAMPGSEWAPFVGKFLGLGLVLVLLMTMLTLSGMLAQSILGYRDFQVELYLKIMFGFQLTEYLLFALLALVIHVLAEQKYIGHLAAIMVFVFIAFLAGMLGIEHKMLIYGASPGWSYNEIRGFGISTGPWLWFKSYWIAWALLLAVVGKLLWARGKEQGLRMRIRNARQRLTIPTVVIAGTAVSLILLLGSFIFYNTNILNHYTTGTESRERVAEYERRYGRYANIPQPSLTRTSLQVDIYPRERLLHIRGTYSLVNRSSASIDSIHITTAAGGAETRTILFDRSTTLAINDDEHGYRIYSLDKPLAPGDTMKMDFEVYVERRGFSNRGADRYVMTLGSYFSSEYWFPFVGYQRLRELMGPGERREYGLEPRPVIASLYEVEGHEPAARGGGIGFDAVVSTDEDEVAVAPGALLRTWTEGGRRYSHYSTDAPIGDEWAFFSAEYAVQEAEWVSADDSSQRVKILIFHSPRHKAPLDYLTKGIRASLDYYSKQFGPYPYGHLTFVEHPVGPGTGMHADPSIVSYGQGYAYWVPDDGQGSLDFPYAIVGHEMAHQWTLPYAFVEGLPFLSEGLAWYSSMQVVKASRGEEQLRRLMYQMREPYPHAPIRRGEPLLRALDPYLSYRRGPFAMYAMSEYIGADRVNSAIRRLVEMHDAPGAPLATTLDLFRELKAVTPDSLKYLLHDLFEVNTYWELETKMVTATQIDPATWQVSLDVFARKTAYDSVGNATELPMNEWIQIGVFANPTKGDELSEPLHVQMHRIREGNQTIKVTVSGKPVRAGIDPYHLLDWEEGRGDNVQEVKD